MTTLRDSADLAVNMDTDANEPNKSTDDTSTKNDSIVIPISPLFSAEEIKNLLTSMQSDNYGNIQKIIITPNILKLIRENLLATIQSMEKNPSMFSQAAEYWSHLSLWEKIVGGATLTVPTLFIGLCFHIGFLLALCGVTTMAYTGSSIILDDHHQCSIGLTKDLTKGILGLVSLLELIIVELDNIRLKLEKEVTKFTQENILISEHINDLKTQVNELNTQIAAATQLTHNLQKTKDELEKTVDTFKEQMDQQNQLLATTQKQLTQATTEHHAAKQQLTEHITELAQVKATLEADLNKANTIAKTLSDSLQEAIATYASLNVETQQEYNHRLKEFITNKEASFISISTIEKELEQTHAQLAEQKSFYAKLLQEQGKQVMVLRKIIEKASKNPHIKEALCELGFFAKNAPILANQISKANDAAEIVGPVPNLHVI
ncbi:MAG: hypothetical protein QM652_05930 [Legionella sp.]|uniref:hypothetical protein n=1 Tax=Legionella sp. TaxID=459 RepID=UPI0039E25457